MIDGIFACAAGGARATLYNADMTDVVSLVSKTAVVITDPPYGMAYNASSKKALSRARRSTSSRAAETYAHISKAIAGDEAAFEPAPMLGFGRCILWGANWYADALPPSGKWLCWDKREETTPDDGSDFELAWTNLPGKASRMHRQLWRGVCLRGEENGRKRLHPTQKPVALLDWCLTQAKVQPGETVFDPYMGSGTLGVACLRRGVHYIGVDIDPAFFDTACARLTDECIKLSEHA